MYQYDICAMVLYDIHVANYLIWMLFGAIIGACVHLLDSGRVKGGIFSTMLLGIVGALLGGIISTTFLDKGFLSLTTAGLAVAVIVSVVLALFARVIFRQRDHIKTIKTQFIH